MIDLAGAALVLIWASVSGTQWRDLGFVRPPHGAIDLVIALVAGDLARHGCARHSMSPRDDLLEFGGTDCTPPLSCPVV